MQVNLYGETFCKSIFKIMGAEVMCIFMSDLETLSDFSDLCSNSNIIFQIKINAPAMGWDMNDLDSYPY